MNNYNLVTASTSKLFTVAHSMLSCDEEGYVCLILSSIKTVQEYAWSQMGILLSREEAARVLVVCRRWEKLDSFERDRPRAYFKKVEWPLKSMSLRLQAV